MNKPITTHRCANSLKEHVSIRKIREDYINKGKECWSIVHYEMDNEWDCLVSQYVQNIKYCPYCGEELKLK